MPKNSDNLRRAQKNKSDEFYTLEKDVEDGVQHYAKVFKKKIVYLPCDGDDSSFVSFFKSNFDNLGLKALCYSFHNPDNPGEDYHVQYSGGEREDRWAGDADFRTSSISQSLLKKCNIVVTNPPFSLLKDFIPWILQAKKKLLVVGNMNAACNRNVFPFIRDRKLWKGPRNKAWDFKFSSSYVNYSAKPSSETINMGGIVWFTNLGGGKIPTVKLTAKYDASKYPVLENYDAINVDRTADIPKDYNGKMAVPVSFFLRYNKRQFKIVDVLPVPILNGKNLYNRLIIQRVRPV